MNFKLVSSVASHHIARCANLASMASVWRGLRAALRHYVRVNLVIVNDRTDANLERYSLQLAKNRNMLGVLGLLAPKRSWRSEALLHWIGCGDWQAGKLTYVRGGVHGFSLGMELGDDEVCHCLGV